MRQKRCVRILACVSRLLTHYLETYSLSTLLEKNVVLSLFMKNVRIDRITRKYGRVQTACMSTGPRRRGEMERGLDSGGENSAEIFDIIIST